MQPVRFYGFSPGGLFLFMSFDDEIAAGFEAANSFVGEEFLLSNHSGVYTGVFAGDSSDVDFDDLQGHDIKISNSVSVLKSEFVAGSPPLVDEVLTKRDCGEKYNVTAVESFENTTWDLSLTRINDG